MEIIYATSSLSSFLNIFFAALPMPEARKLIGNKQL